MILSLGSKVWAWGVGSRVLFLSMTSLHEYLVLLCLIPFIGIYKKYVCIATCIRTYAYTI